MADAQTRHYDLVVIGAGIFGLATARNFHALFPNSSLLVLEAMQGLGGTWAMERLHPDLKSNNLWGTYEFPDYPMPTADGKVLPGEDGKKVDDGGRRYAVLEGEHIPGLVLNQYIEDYARDGGVLGMVECGKRVVTATHLENGGWVLAVDGSKGKVKGMENIQDGNLEEVMAKKLVVATGLTSQPFLPKFVGEEEFGGTIFHARDLWKVNRWNKEFRDHKWEANIGGPQTPPTGEKIVEYPRKKIVVLGSTKTGWDQVYAFATRGFEVDWIIRESGYGPAWMSPIRVTPWKIRLEHIVQSRLITWMSPCIWGSVDGYWLPRWLLQGNPIGRTIVRAFWWVIGNDALTLSRLREHPETRKLIPWSQPMFVGTGFSILNYDKDILSYVRDGQVKIHIADIVRLSKGTVHLSDGNKLDADGVSCATGWRHLPPLKFLPEGIEREIGIPHSYGNTAEEDVMIKQADEIVLNRFPILRNPPMPNKKYRPLPGSEGIVLSSASSSTDSLDKEKPVVKSTLTPYRLFRFMIPPSSSFLKTRDLAFVGMLMNFSVDIMAHIQGIWVSEFLMGTHPLFPLRQQQDSDEGGSVEEPVAMEERIEKHIQWETILHCTHCKHRCPYPNGERHPDFVFDALPYVDMLCQDLGLRNHRKGWGKEWWKVYKCQDYADALDNCVD